MVVCIKAQRKVVAKPTRQETRNAETDNSDISVSGEFRFFSRLPLELQRAVWRECLPRRILTFYPEFRHARLDDPTAQTCHVPNTLFLRRTSPPPLIAQVCREARVVALEHGGFYHIGRQRVSRCTFPPISAWFDSSTDIALPSGALAETCPMAGPTGLPRSSIIAFPFDRVNGGFKQSGYRHLGKHCKCFGDRLKTVIIVRHVKIHASRQTVLDSGLFGLLGEETVVLVDLHDRERLLKFCKVDQPPEDSGPQPHIRKVLEEMKIDDSSDKEKLDTNFERIIRQILEDRWLDLHISTAPKDEDGQRDPSIYPAEATRTFERYDRTHWWVQKTLQKLVSFELKIAIELCKPGLDFI